MQLIVWVKLKVEQYVKESFHTRMRPPERCGHCGGVRTLESLGYYDRYTTGESGTLILFKVRRFLCEVCKRTTSSLPSFAQPYRLVGNDTIDAFINEEADRPDVQRNQGLLECYQKRFITWEESLRDRVGNVFGRGPPKESATAFWRRAVATCGSMAELTFRLVQDFKTTCFGTYRCHLASSAP